MSIAGAIEDIATALEGAGLIRAPMQDMSLVSTGRHTIDNAFAIQVISAGLPVRQSWIDERGKRALMQIQVGSLVPNQERATAFANVVGHLEKCLDTLIGFTSANILSIQQAANPPIQPVQDDRIIGTFPIEVRYIKA